MSGIISLQEKPEEASDDDDDMACGDLGNGLDRRRDDGYKLEGFSISTSRSKSGSAQKSSSSFMLLNKGEVCDAAVFRCSRCNSLNDTLVKKMGIMNGSPCCSRQNSFDANSEVSYDELRQQLQEAVEEVEILRVELEASQRQLEGKEQALKILQSMAMLDKATSHTKALCKKTEQQRRALEKEINVLQWELKVNQEKFKNQEDSWAEKYDRLYCENAAFKETLKLKSEEVKTLKSENEFLERQYLEILATLDVKQQKTFQEIKSFSKSGVVEITGLELAVLGACTCNGPEADPCSCAKMSVATRKQLFQLKQEFELLKKSKEEAFVMADAFRIAFEQQLMRRKDQALRLAQMSKICQREKKLLTWKSIKDDGCFKFQGNRKNLGKRLMSRLASGSDSKKIEELDNPEEVIRMLIDLLNDNEEALAHQRKVSYMLARALEEKESSLQPNKDNKCSEEEFAFSSTQCKNNSETQERPIPVCSDSNTCTALEGSCSFSNTCPSKMPDSSPEVLTSLTSEENSLHKTEEMNDAK